MDQETKYKFKHSNTVYRFSIDYFFSGSVIFSRLIVEILVSEFLCFNGAHIRRLKNAPT